MSIQGEAATPLISNEQTSSYELVISDAENRIIVMNSGSANNLTVPKNAKVPFKNGTCIPIRQKGAGQTTVVAGDGVTVNVNSALTLKLTGQHSFAMLIKGEESGSNTWTLTGDLEAV